MELREYAEQLAMVKNRRSEIKEEEKALIQEQEHAEEQIAMLMLNAGQDRVSFPGIGTFSPNIKHYPRITDEEKFFEYLKKEGHEHLIKKVVAPQTLKAWFTEQVFEQPIADIGLDDYTKTKINFRRR